MPRLQNTDSKMIGHENCSNSPAADHDQIIVDVQENNNMPDCDEHMDSSPSVVDEVPSSPGRLSERRMRQVQETTSSRNGR